MSAGLPLANMNQVVHYSCQTLRSPTQNFQKSTGGEDIYISPQDFPLLDKAAVGLSGGGGAAVSAAPRRSKPRSPPPDLPSLLLDARIVYLGMPLVPAVTELIVSELLYLQYTDRTKPVYIYINSTGTTRADGETVGFETEGTAIYDTMCYLKNPVRI
jgi:hypothetical protein